MTAPTWPEPGLQHGEVVDITITGAVVSGPIGNCLLIGFGQDTMQLSPGNTTAVITRSTPADGEPEVGDIWVDQLDQRYVANRYYDANERLYLFPLGDGVQKASPWADVHKGLSGPIRLLYRLSDGGAA